jgi:hypothetical protein
VHWRSVVVVEDLAQFAREGFGLAGVSELADEEAAVVARAVVLGRQLGMKVPEVKNRAMITWAIEIGRHPGVVQVAPRSRR